MPPWSTYVRGDLYRLQTTEAHFGIGRLSANRPKKVFGFQLFEGNNRNRNRELAGRLFGVLFNFFFFFRQVRTPMKKKHIIRVRV